MLCSDCTIFICWLLENYYYAGNPNTGHVDTSDLLQLIVLLIPNLNCFSSTVLSLVDRVTTERQSFVSAFMKVTVTVEFVITLFTDHVNTDVYFNIFCITSNSGSSCYSCLKFE